MLRCAALRCATAFALFCRVLGVCAGAALAAPRLLVVCRSSQAAALGHPPLSMDRICHVAATCPPPTPTHPPTHLHTHLPPRRAVPQPRLRHQPSRPRPRCHPEVGGGWIGGWVVGRRQCRGGLAAAECTLGIAGPPCAPGTWRLALLPRWLVHSHLSHCARAPTLHVRVHSLMPSINQSISQPPRCTPLLPCAAAVTPPPTMGWSIGWSKTFGWVAMGSVAAARVECGWGVPSRHAPIASAPLSLVHLGFRHHARPPSLRLPLDCLLQSPFWVRCDTAGGSSPFFLRGGLVGGGTAPAWGQVGGGGWQRGGGTRLATDTPLSARSTCLGPAPAPTYPPPPPQSNSVCRAKRATCV